MYWTPFWLKYLVQLSPATTSIEKFDRAIAGQAITVLLLAPSIFIVVPSINWRGLGIGYYYSTALDYSTVLDYSTALVQYNWGATTGIMSGDDSDDAELVSPTTLPEDYIP